MRQRRSAEAVDHPGPRPRRAFLMACVGENTSHSVFIESSVDAELREEIVWSVANYTAVSDISMFISTSSSSDVKVRAVNYGKKRVVRVHGVRGRAHDGLRRLGDAAPWHQVVQAADLQVQPVLPSSGIPVGQQRASDHLPGAGSHDRAATRDRGELLA